MYFRIQLLNMIKVAHLLAGAVVCILMSLYVGKLATGHNPQDSSLHLPSTILLVYACAGILSVCAFQLAVGIDTISTKPVLLIPLFAPLLILMNELARERDWECETKLKLDKFAAFRASVLVSAALASASSLPPETGKYVLAGALIVAASVLPFSSASSITPSGAISSTMQRALMLIMTWVIVGVVIKNFEGFKN